MKKLSGFYFFVYILSCSIFSSEFVIAQAPLSTSYQAVIRNNNGALVSNQTVNLRFSIHDSTADGPVVYQETHTPVTTAQGLVNVNVGMGASTTGNFANISWGNKSKFLQMELDINGGTNYTDMGAQQLMSVPYALYATKSQKADTALYSANSMPIGNANGDILYWNGTTWVTLPIGNYGQTLSACDGVLSWGGCAPKVTTNSTSAISFTAATSGGNVIAEGGAYVTARGVCWSTNINPTVELATKSNDGTGAGSFTSSITGLNFNTIYYVRAYATNSVGTSYGAQQTFTTSTPTLPTISTTTPSAVSFTTATCGGNVTSDGGVPVLFRGVCWSTSTNPTVALTTKTVNGIGTGSFISRITALTSNTVYYIRAYATNSVGTVYGAQQVFTTIDNTLVDSPAVIIGTQIWSSKNLDVASYRNGDPIPQVTDATTWENLTTGAWCWYNNDSATYAATYGRLYNWYAVNDPRGLAPTGWHVSTVAEWNKLVKSVDPSADTLSQAGYHSSTAGGALKSTSFWAPPPYNIVVTNSSGFAGLPGGLRLNDGPFVGGGNGFDTGSGGYWWSANEVDTNTAWCRFLLFDDNYVYWNAVDKTLGMSVRIVKD